MCASFFSGVNARPTVFRIGCCITGSLSGFTMQIYGFCRTTVNLTPDAFYPSFPIIPFLISIASRLHGLSPFSWWLRSVAHSGINLG